ncbi:hypothetical protein [Leptolyngbya sp. 7M]|uniref:hypothetical protein n=1 Tax=Leptolyngbya sp. 7M TaxID=2812896 RepID=UPI001B8CFB3E|nr:hypothetical protein [Leptolyngbya sp. 7M]QYO67516.1 hypothetical protein JVX88_12405 [Leptolyngbya sp. 7M]
MPVDSLAAEAKQLQANHNTIAGVYSSLTDSGYLTAQRGKGTFVADTLCVQNLIKNNQHYVLLRQAFTAAQEINVSPAEFAGAAYAQAVLISSSQSNSLQLVFVEEQSPSGLELYQMVQAEVGLPIAFAGWADVIAQQPEVMSQLRSADLVITTTTYAASMTQMSGLGQPQEIVALAVRPSVELLTQASSLPQDAQLLIIGCDQAEAKRLKHMLQEAGIAHIQIQTADLEQSQRHPKQLDQFDALCCSPAVQLQLQTTKRKMTKRIRHPHLSVFSFRVDPTHLLVLKARLNSIRSN